MKNRTSKYTKEMLENAVSSSNSMRDVLRKLELPITGGSHTLIKKKIIEHNVDISKLTGARKTESGWEFEAVPLEQVMIEHSTYSRGHLKNRLLKDGIIENKCAICGQIPEWNGIKLVMVLDHINGVNDDHRKENLRMLCPNCNSQQETFSRGIKIKGDTKPRCPRCNKKVSSKNSLCMTCSSFLQRRCERPSKEELEKMILDIPMTKIGKMFGVSDNAVRKWCKSYGIVL